VTKCRIACRASAPSFGQAATISRKSASRRQLWRIPSARRSLIPRPESPTVQVIARAEESPWVTGRLSPSLFPSLSAEHDQVRQHEQNPDLTLHAVPPSDGPDKGQNRQTDSFGQSGPCRDDFRQIGRRFGGVHFARFWALRCQFRCPSLRRVFTSLCRIGT
jgi:hypothetical protein